MDKIKNIEKITVKPDEYLLVEVKEGATDKDLDNVSKKASEIFSCDRDRLVVYRAGDMIFRTIKIEDYKDKEIQH